MKMKSKYLLPMFLFFITGYLSAQEQEDDKKEIKLEVKAPEEVLLGKAFRVAYTVINAENIDLDFPQKMKGFETQYGPMWSSSASTQVIEGKTISTKAQTFTYILMPLERGKYKLPEISIEVEGKKYKAERPEIEVLSLEDLQKKYPEDFPSREKKDNKKKKYEIKDEDAFIRTIIEEQKADGGKILEVSLRLYVAEKTDISGISNILDFEEPDFSQFNIVRRYSPGRRMALTKYEGKNYYATDIRKFILTPKRSGKVEIEGGHFDIVFRVRTGEVERSFFGPVEVEAEVRKTIRVENFTLDGGLVGDWHTI